MTDDQKLDMITNLIRDPFHDCPDLNDQERQVLNLVSEGEYAIRIARTLGFSRAYFYKLINKAIPKLRHFYDRPNLTLADLRSFKLERIEEVLQ